MIFKPISKISNSCKLTSKENFVGKGVNVVNSQSAWFKLILVKLLKYWIPTQQIMKTAKHQLIIHERSKETKTNSYRDSFLDCIGIKYISYNKSCISMIDVKKVILLSILSIWSVFNECYSRNVSFLFYKT